MELSIVIPAYNEADTIEATLKELEEYLFRYKGSSDWEIIVVNDGSTDATLDILFGIRDNKEWLKVVDLGAHFGRGRALREGIKASTGDIIISLDADLSYAPYHIERMVDKLNKEKADIVLSSAYREGGTVKNVPLKRLWISRIGNKILSYMFGEGISVLTCLVRAYRKDFIKRLDLHSDDKEIHLEILYKTRILGGKIVEIPADLCWRKEKLTKQKISTTGKRRSTMNIKKTSTSHLFFALMNKPGIIFMVPGYILMAISVFIFFLTVPAIAKGMLEGLSLYLSIRMSMLNAAPSWFTMGISFIIAILFFMLGFLTNQSKRNYEETYKTLNAIYSKLK
jgi:glycosyltransferase involved in cell wall biosynthesis